MDKDKDKVKDEGAADAAAHAPCQMPNTKWWRTHSQGPQTGAAREKGNLKPQTPGPRPRKKKRGQTKTHLQVQGAFLGAGCGCVVDEGRVFVEQKAVLKHAVVDEA